MHAMPEEAAPTTMTSCVSSSVMESRSYSGSFSKSHTWSARDG